MTHYRLLAALSGCLIVATCLSPALAAAAFTDPATTASFSVATAGFTQIDYDSFGTNTKHSIRTLTSLASVFNPYGIAGTIVINKEWERYKTFNAVNFALTSGDLNITAAIPHGGGLFAGGITSGQIWSHQTFQPGVTGHTMYAFDVRMKIPGSIGMWPCFWLYSPNPSKWRDASEIDVAEFMEMTAQNSHDWTGHDHGPGVGAKIFSRLTNAYTWAPGYDFSSAYHDYQLIWTPDATYKYVDGLLIYAQKFKWTSRQSAQFGVNLAVGSSESTVFPGLRPTSLSQFPDPLSITSISVWAK